MKSEYTLGHYGWIYYYNILNSVPRKFGNPQFVYILNNIAYSHIILWHATVNG